MGPKGETAGGQPRRISFSSPRCGFGLNSPKTTATTATVYSPNLAAATATSAPATNPAARKARSRLAQDRESQDAVLFPRDATPGRVIDVLEFGVSS